MILRRRSPTEIKYIYVSCKFDIISPVIPPLEFDNDVISFIKYCPKDILQLNDAINYYEFIYRFAFNNPYDYKIIIDTNLKTSYPIIFSLKQIKIFFLDSDSQLLEDNLEYLRSIHCPIHFYYIVNRRDNVKVEIENLLKSPDEFITSLINNQDEILRYLGYENFNICPSLSLNYKKLINLDYFTPTRNNFFLINALIGNFGIRDPEPENKADKERIICEESKKAQQQPNTFERQNLFINQIKKLDYFMTVGLSEKIFSIPIGIEAYFSPLIIIAPFCNPEIDKFHGFPKTKEAEEMLSVFHSEQTENYISYRNNNGPNNMLLGAGFTMKLLKYLDDVSFLHASNSFSPIIRLPIKGKSIYKELSFFRTSGFAHLTNTKNRKNLQKTISKFSEVYKKTTISPELGKVLKQRNSQIILISDLPLEWLRIENVPISFTHDICRLPMTSLHGLMSIFSSHNVFEYLIPKDIYKKTLVIFGSNDPKFRIWQDVCSALSIEKGFKTKLCLTISAVEEEINRCKPEFLIFDCHGSYNEKLRSTVLWIGNEELTPEIIVKKHLATPIVFLSACGTAPTYGVINSIANAFFEAGSLSVTTTYLPVEINSSSILYLRLLNKLGIACINGIHKNWLEFVCHIIRSSDVMEKFRIALKKVKNNDMDILVNKNVSILTELLIFNKRRQIFKTIDSDLGKICHTNSEAFVQSIPEYLLYSNLGRSDLINFESWIENYRKKNNSEFSEEGYLK